VERTFLSLFGGLLFFNQDMLNHIRINSQKIIKSYVTKKSMARFDDDYEIYKDFKFDIAFEYKAYKKNSNEYYNALKSVPNKIKDTNQKILESQKSGWEQYQSGVNKFKSQSKTRAKNLAPEMYEFFNDRAKCKSDSCRNRYNAGYAKKAKKNGFSGIKPDFWLAEEDVSVTEQVAKHAASAVLTVGLSLLLEGINYLSGGESSIKDKKYFYTNDVNHYTKKIMEAKKSSFARSSGGYEHAIATYSHFKMHPQTQKNTVKTLMSQHGIKVSDSWQIGDDNALGNAIKKAVSKKVTSSWKNTVKRQGLKGLKPV
jgi:hypothetical protein